jgi:competence protein ComEC
VLPLNQIDQFDSSLLKKIPKKMSLGWFDQTFQSTQSAQSPQIQTSSIPTLKPGQRWQFTVRLKRPHGNANPNGFDYEVWLLEQGVRATGIQLYKIVY